MFENVVAEITGSLFWLINIIINSTIRLRVVNEEMLGKIHKQGKQIIFASWHGQFFPAIHYYRNRKICIMPISALRGKIIASLAKKYGFKVIPYPEFGTPGERIESTQRMLKTVKEGYDMALVVDGPPKPEFHKVNPGVLYFSQKTGFPLIPIGICMKRKFTMFWRWDKYEIPLPFSKVVLVIGEPFVIPDGVEVLELQKKTKELEERLDKVSLDAKIWSQRL